MQLRFDDFTLDLDRLEIRKGATSIPMERKNFDLLVLLVENRARAVTMDEIFAAIWPGVIVTEASRSTAIGQVRKALGDDGRQQRFIKTIRGRGFRFLADVHAAAASSIVVTTPSSTPPVQTAYATRPIIAVLPFA